MDKKIFLNRSSRSYVWIRRATHGSWSNPSCCDFDRDSDDCHARNCRYRVRPSTAYSYYHAQMLQRALRRNLVLRFLGKSLRRASPCELLPTLPAHLALPRRDPIPPPHPRQRGSAVSATSALGGHRRRIDG